MRRTYNLETFTLRVGRVPFWQVAIGLAVAFVLAVALAVLVSGLFLILLPVILIGAIAARFMGRRDQGGPRRDQKVIDAEYVVVEESRADDRTPSDENPRDK